MRTVCPTCQTLMIVDDADRDTRIECTQCLSSFTAKPDDGPTRIPPRTRPHSDGGGYAAVSLILGIISIPSACCLVGGILGLIGFFTGWMGLQSRSRSMAIFGILFSLAGMLLAVSMIALFGIMMNANNRDVPAAAEGIQAPFVKQ